MLDALVQSGIGVPLSLAQTAGMDQWWKRCRPSNEALLGELRDDPYAQQLLAITRDDAKKGRMSWPIRVDDEALASSLLHSRCLFGFVHGAHKSGLAFHYYRFAVSKLKDDGTVKDNFSWSVQLGESVSQAGTGNYVSCLPCTCKRVAVRSCAGPKKRKKEANVNGHVCNEVLR